MSSMNENADIRNHEQQAAEEASMQRPFTVEVLKHVPGNLQLKISILILVPVTIILTLATAIEYRRNQERHLNIMSNLAAQTGQVIEDTLQRDMLLSDFTEIQAAIDALGSDDQVRSIYILDPEGNIAFAPSGSEDLKSLNSQDEACQGCHRLPPEQRPSGTVVTRSDGKRVFRSMHPIENQPECTRCHDPQNRLLGLLLSDQSIAPVEEALTLALRDNIITWIGVVMVTAVLSNVAVFQFIVQRLRGITTAMERFGSGESQRPLPEIPGDEIGSLGSVFNKMSSKIRQREEENQQLTDALDSRISERGELLKKLLSVQEEERKRVAREIHDEVGQGLSSIALSIELTERALESDPSSSREHLKQASKMVAESTNRMYDLIIGLRPSALDDLGLISALRAHIQRNIEPSGISVVINASDLPDRLPSEIETTLFRLFQEALTNILRHSQASKVTLTVELEDGGVRGKVIDNGTGFQVQELKSKQTREKGLGILGMRERVEHFNGTLDIDSKTGEGTQVSFWLPLKDEGNG